jgi:predicted porin
LTYRTVWHTKWLVAALPVVALLFARSAAADVMLMEHEGWEVFMNGRIQTFVNHNEGQGQPANTGLSTALDANGKQFLFLGGGLDKEEGAVPEYKMGTSATADDQGLVREMRLRSGFTGNVLGFGVRRRLSDQTDILGYSAVTVGIDSEQRRKFNNVRPDWRESFVRVTSTWGSLTFGRTLTLYSRGATEITYLYGYRYGLGFPGTVSNFSQSTAGSVGFGVMANGFGAGLAYASPVMGGLQISVGVYDANNIPQRTWLNRSRWPQVQSEVTFQRNLGSTGLLKLFANGAYQQLFDIQGRPLSAEVFGTGFGGRFEIGPVRFGVAGHWGKGIGVTYSLEPHTSLYFEKELEAANGDSMSACGMSMYSACPRVKMRTVDGLYAQAQIAVLKNLDVRAGYGFTRIHRLPEDRRDWRDDDSDPATDSANDDVMDSMTGLGGPGTPDSAGYVTIRQQIGVGGGLTWHAADSLHFTVEYFRAMFDWYKPSPEPANARNPSQTMNSINAGLTYDF